VSDNWKRPSDFEDQRYAFISGALFAATLAEGKNL